MKLKTVTLRGYKSIAKLEAFELRNLNVLIGANGAGKSNFIGIFKLLAALATGCLLPKLLSGELSVTAVNDEVQHAF